LWHMSTFIHKYIKLNGMGLPKIGIVVFILSVLLVMSAGCINSNSATNSANQPAMTPQANAAAIELHTEGFAAFTNGNYQAALDFYNQSIAADPKYTRAWMDKGNTLIFLNRTEEAISAYDSALALDKDLALVWNSRGEALMKLGRYSEARDSFDKALQVAPDFALAKVNRNLTLSKLK
jgi:tetratricopeptide (TPR) repeat protein